MKYCGDKYKVQVHLHLGVTTGFSDRDLASQCHCIPVAFFLHASCHYLLVAYLSSFQCQLDAQYNLQQAFLKQCIVT